MNHCFSLVLVLAAAPLVACGDDKPPPKTAADTAKPAPSATTAARPNLPAEPPSSPTTSALRISDEIVKACGLSEPDAYFAFDSAHLRQEDANLLQQVATCFTTGALKGRSMRLVGHADPRGSTDYNLALGQSRADAVKTFMIGKGMDSARTTSASRGDMDAQGTDEPSWARDRRVDMMIAQ
jgi:peptidoglycan-associated lipoprotein